jgi:hypothetical protein
LGRFRFAEPAPSSPGKTYAVKINALLTVASTALSSLGAVMTNPVQRNGLLLLAVVVLFAQWHAHRRSQQRKKAHDALLATMHKLSEEAALLGCSEIAARHPELRCELRIFERAVMRSLADIHHGRLHAIPLSVIQRLVTVNAPALLETVKEYDDRFTVQNVCQQFRRMSQRLLPQAPVVRPADTTFVIPDTQSSGQPTSAPSTRVQPGPAVG